MVNAKSVLTVLLLVFLFSVQVALILCSAYMVLTLYLPVGVLWAAVIVINVLFLPQYLRLL